MRNLQQILARRAVLLQRISRQRAELGGRAHALERPSRLIDKTVLLARQIRLHPLLAGGIGLVSLFIFRQRLPVAKMALTAMAAVRWWLYLKTAKTAPFPEPRRATSQT